MPELVKLHYKDGTTAEMDSIDARRALRDHPSEWSTEPFPEETRKSEAENTRKAAADEQAKRDAAAKKLQDEADEKAREEQAKADVEAARIKKQQDEKAKADEAARNGQAGQKPSDPPVTNDGLKVGHIPSEEKIVAVTYEAKHRGAGSYSVMDSNGNEVLDKLSKEDAETFNGLSADEKAEYVTAEKAAN